MPIASLACAIWALSLSAHAFDLQGHRGARGLAPENTLAAFRTALDLGVSTLETDMAVTRDGVVVVPTVPQAETAPRPLSTVPQAETAYKEAMSLWHDGAAAKARAALRGAPRRTTPPRSR